VELVDVQVAQHDFFLGPVINRWVDPARPTRETLNKELSTPLGRARVAAKVTDLGDGRWRYEYALMNFDYAHVRFDPVHAEGADIRLLESRGFARFGVPLPRGVIATSLHFDDADGNAGNDWTAATTGDTVGWSAPDASDTLAWGTLYHFEFTANAPPTARRVAIGGAATATEAERPYTIDLIGPAARRAAPRRGLR
jgi:hypothetical protein